MEHTHVVWCPDCKTANGDYDDLGCCSRCYCPVETRVVVTAPAETQRRCAHERAPAGEVALYCMTAHYHEGQPLPPCERCRKCGAWLRYDSLVVGARYLP